jgi:hypothetical protein
VGPVSWFRPGGGFFFSTLPDDARPPPAISRHRRRHDRDLWRGTALQHEAKLTRSGGSSPYPCPAEIGFFLFRSDDATGKDCPSAGTVADSAAHAHGNSQRGADRSNRPVDRDNLCRPGARAGGPPCVDRCHTRHPIRGRFRNGSDRRGLRPPEPGPDCRPRERDRIPVTGRPFILAACCVHRWEHRCRIHGTRPAADPSPSRLRPFTAPLRPAGLTVRMVALPDCRADCGALRLLTVAYLRGDTAYLSRHVKTGCDKPKVRKHAWIKGEMRV